MWNDIEKPHTDVHGEVLPFSVIWEVWFRTPSCPHTACERQLGSKFKMVRQWYPTFHHMNLLLRLLYVKNIYILFGFFSQKHGPQWKIFSLRNTWFPPSTKNLGSVPRFPSSSAQTRCYLVENVKFSSAFQVMVSLRCCLSKFLKKLFCFHKRKGVYLTSRMKSLMPIPIIRLYNVFKCLYNVFKCLHSPRYHVGSTPVFVDVFWWAVIVLAWFS